MASHRSRLPTPCIAALLLLLLAAVISSEASSTVLQAHLEPADEAGYRTYIVLLQAPVQHMDADAHRAWHKSFLPSLRTSLGEPRLRRSYSTLLHGFSARLTEEGMERVSAKPGFVRAFPVPADHEDAGFPRPPLPHGAVALGLDRLWRP